MCFINILYKHRKVTVKKVKRLNTGKQSKNKMEMIKPRPHIRRSAMLKHRKKEFT